MATNAATGSIELEEFARILRAALLRIDSLRALVNAQGQAALDLPGLRQGLNELEQMVGELLYALQEAGGELSLAALPDISLTESLSQLVESTAETLGLSSRVLFTGHERP